jgi:hypothetical protein
MTLSTTFQIIKSKIIIIYDLYIKRKPFKMSVETVNLMNEVHHQPESEEQAHRRIRCSFCGGTGHNIRNCQCPEKQLMELRMREYTSITEGPLFYMSPEDIEYQLFDEIHGCVYSETGRNQLDLYDLRRLDSVSLKKKLQMLCIILNIRTPRMMNTMMRHIISEITRIRNQLIENETDEMRSVRMEAYRRRIVNNLLTNGRKQLAEIDYNEIMHLRGKYKQYKTILSQLGQTAEPEIQNMFIFTNIALMNVKEQIRASILQYQMVYGDHDSFRLILKEINDEFITIVKELVEEGEEWEDIECPICYDKIDSSYVCMTNCFHKYCFQCLSKALKTNKERNCPCCRRHITQVINKSHVVLNDEIPDAIIL